MVYNRWKPWIALWWINVLGLFDKTGHILWIIFWTERERGCAFHYVGLNPEQSIIQEIPSTVWQWQGHKDRRWQGHWRMKGFVKVHTWVDVLYKKRTKEASISLTHINLGSTIRQCNNYHIYGGYVRVRTKGDRRLWHPVSGMVLGHLFIRVHEKQPRLFS